MCRRGTFYFAALVRAAGLLSAQNPSLQGHPEDYARADIEYGARLYSEHATGATAEMEQASTAWICGAANSAMPSRMGN